MKWLLQGTLLGSSHYYDQARKLGVENGAGAHMRRPTDEVTPVTRARQRSKIVHLTVDFILAAASQVPNSAYSQLIDSRRHSNSLVRESRQCHPKVERRRAISQRRLEGSQAALESAVVAMEPEDHTPQSSSGSYYAGTSWSSSIDHVDEAVNVVVRLY